MSLTMTIMRSVWILLVSAAVAAQENQTCAWDGCTSGLEEMTVNVGHGNETALVYVSPDISTFYQDDPGSRREKKPSFNGMLGKFINLSPDPVRVFWDDGTNRENTYIADIVPFDAAATATFPGHVFLVTPKADPNTVLERFEMKSGESLYAYDPVQDPSALNDQQLQLYTLQKENLEFAAFYHEFTGRDWLALYRQRSRPRYHMWPADYFGQNHVVSTSETHFHTLPEDISPIQAGERRQLQDYRSPDMLNMTLKVVSCEPRVFVISNFLSETEVDHILELATGMDMKLSTTQAGTDAQARTDTATRTSRNTWLQREKSPIVDALYRRAADLLQMDESLLRRRTPDEHPELRTRGSISEHLQLVHYARGEQYTPHHDFSVPRPQAKDQPSRFATVLFYLNDGMEGGETSFPRWRSAESHEPLKVAPEKGKAVLFYSVLPDGNMDERSQHAALPVKKGEKWLTNLWVWDPDKRQ